LKNGTADRQAAAKIALTIKLIAESDVQEGMLGSSNYLLDIAEKSSRWQQSINDNSE
jgi:hypothetical protein